MLPQAADPRTHPRIGRYVITGRIGRGGMGMVYRGLDEALEREVAVKTLNAEGTLDTDSRRRFEVEARAAARLQHPNIVTVYELGEDRGLPFIAMEMLPGADLEAVLRSGEDIPLTEKLDVVAQVCRGLAYAHERGIVHRDIKPSNVRLLEDGTAKIMDFGIAKREGIHLTKTGMMVGTVHYMSPEQVRGKPLDGRSDVFSVGVILYELLAGERPFRGEGATQVLYKIVNEEPPPPDLTALGDFAPRLQEILQRALAKDPDARYPGAAALGDDLAAMLEDVQKGEGPPPALAVEALAAARKAAPRGHGEEAVARLRGLVASYPGFLVARRALRAALREQETRCEPDMAEPESYPELEATFQAAPTRREAPPAPLPTVAISSTATPGVPAPAVTEPATRQAWIWGAAALLGVAAVAAILLLRGSGPAAPTGVRLSVRSQPMGASVLLDGRDTGVVTNGELAVPAPVPKQVVLTFRKAGHRDETRSRQPSAAGGRGRLGHAADCRPPRPRPHAAARGGGHRRRGASGGPDSPGGGPRPDGRAPRRCVARRPRRPGSARRERHGAGRDRARAGEAGAGGHGDRLVLVPARRALAGTSPRPRRDLAARLGSRRTAGPDPGVELAVPESRHHPPGAARRGDLARRAGRGQAQRARRA